MLDDLKHHEEQNCIKDVAIGASTVAIFLTALTQYCGDIIKYNINEQTAYTFEGRYLYEVVINGTHEETTIDSRPIIMIDAGRQGGTEPVTLALFLIEQLVACEENDEMIEKVQWIILPSANPDGQEFNRVDTWRKNRRVSDNVLGIGVDISRNFESQWGSCPKIESGFSPIYPGVGPVSENETLFIKNLLLKYKKDIKVYLSIRRDGHAILYPYGYTKNHPANSDRLIKVAANVAAKVNQRAGGLSLFLNHSIYESEEKERCGHSVDYAYDLGIPLAYEMRVFLGSNNLIMSKFHTLPRGYEASLRNGYYSGIRELYNIIIKEKQYGRVY
ncbi:carboxypeptidase B-like [Galleria mellonella]|uniref:Carboxypeptidase B-like n=1 Tax=Galleria mellonella TaxID=7137 RepID=A0A6J1X1R3_GALME|nr:carboxypeptidase B-like [Galleria mellonella]